MPPLHRQTEKVYSTKNHICGSLRAIKAWFHLKDPVSMTPVLFLRVRCTAIARSVAERKMALLGLSGSNDTSQKAKLAVIAPRKRKINCQLAIVCISMLPIP